MSLLSALSAPIFSFLIDNRVEANLDDVNSTLNGLDINVNELLNYVNNVEPVPFIHDAPKLPAKKSSNLNFLKPGSTEVLTRPVHIYEHLPPMLPAESSTVTLAQRCPQNSTLQESSASSAFDLNVIGDEVLEKCNTLKSCKSLKKEAHAFVDTTVLRKRTLSGEWKNGPSIALGSSSAVLKPTINPMLLDDEGRPTREISSVVMTTGGFISPAFEGKLPDAIVPDFVEKLKGFDAPPPPTPTPPPPQPLLSSVQTAVALTTQPILKASIDTLHPHEACFDTDLKKDVRLGASIDGLPSTISISSQSKFNSTGVQIKNSGNIQGTHFYTETVVPPSLGTGSIVMSQNTSVTKTLDSLVSKKPVSIQQVSPHSSSQAPTLASKLLKKARNKSNPNTTLSISGKNSHSDKSIPLDIVDKTVNLVPTDKVQRKNKKSVQKILKASSDSPSFNEKLTLPRLHMGKVIKKHSRYQKKLINKYNQTFGDRAESPRKERLNPDMMNGIESDGNKSSLSLNVPNTPLLNSVSNTAYSKEIMYAPVVRKDPQSTHNTQLPVFLTGALRAQSTILCGNDDMSGVYCSVPAIKAENFKKITDAPDKDTPTKLSTELDQVKLNIFKKISKQKTPKPVSPNMTRMMLSTQTHSGTENQVINLPSGTTITPAPAPLVHPIFPSDSNIATTEGNTFGNTNSLSSNQIPHTVSEISIIGTTTEDVSQPDVSNKPKKRGRKPGSKNLRKIPTLVPLEAPSLKKVKKSKTDKYLYPFPMVMGNTPNLIANRFQFGSNAPDFIPNPTSMHEKFSGNLKTIKESKKVKYKNVPINLIEMDKVGGGIAVAKSGKSVPSKEEVNTINKKLMRMDTVLKPLMTLEDYCTGACTKLSPNSKSPSTKKRAPHQQQQHQEHQQSSSGVFSNIPPIGLGYSNLLNLYPFPPRPGLIPTASNLLLPRLAIQNFPLSFPNLKPQTTAKVNNIELSNSEKNLDSLLQPSSERSYCNVAPLVPESMKLTSPDSKAEKIERDYPRTPKFQQNSTQSDKMLKNLDVWNTSSSMSSKAIPITPGGISLLTYDSNMPRHHIDDKNKGNTIIDGSTFINQSFTQMSHKSTGSHKSASAIAMTVNADDPIELSDDSTDAPTKQTQLPSAVVSGSITNSKEKLGLGMPHTFTPLLEDDTAISNNVKLPLASNMDLSVKEIKKSRKANKVPKNINKNVLSRLMAPETSMNLTGLEIFSADKVGVGKLAGGADLIPLASTGLAYSSKTIPSTSLTATVATPYVISNKDCPTANSFESQGISVCSESTDGNICNTDMQKRKKDHKKLKKLKEDKVKRKKEKKDKSKSRDRLKCLEKYLYKNEKLLKDKTLNTNLQFSEDKSVDKELLRKLKKEKKRKHKQLIAGDTNTRPLLADTNANVICTDKSSSNLQFSSPEISASLNSTASALVPKLTLKLGSGQSPTPLDETLHKYNSTTTLNVDAINERSNREPSPELARISPLVTRPPKQKAAFPDIVNTSAIGVTATPPGSHINNSLDTVESSVSADTNTFLSTSNNTALVNSHIPPPSPWLVGGTLSASSVLLPQQLLQSKAHADHTTTSGKANINAIVNTTSSTRTTTSERQSPVSLISETSRPSSYIDAEGNRVWICPACGKVDDGSPMIGCDGCDAWYHWICVGISIAPKDNEDWFCRVCIIRKKGMHGSDKRRKRSRKK